MKCVRYYDSFDDDFEESADQNFTIPDDYRRVRNGLMYRVLSAVTYAVALVFGSVYCRLCLHMKIHGRKNLKKADGGYFIYGNHTQPLGDVFTPALCAFPRRIYTVVSPANYGIPVIGKILPYLGALPTASTLGGMRDFNAALETRIKSSHPIVIYPEAHVWEYCSSIRPFPDTSFRFPQKLNCASFAMTSVYKRSRLHRRPTAHVYIDGPYYPSGNNARECAASLCEQVRSAMENRAAQSDISYIEYKKRDDL